MTFFIYYKVTFIYMNVVRVTLARLKDKKYIFIILSQ